MLNYEDELFFFATLNPDITNYVKSCPICQKLKPTSVQLGIMTKNTSEPELMRKLCTDVLGPLNINGKKIYILTMIDSFSKFMFLRATQNLNTRTVIDLLKEVIAQFPPPKKLFTDNATYFISNKLKSFCEENGIKLRHAVAYTPTTNGLIERPNQWITNSIKALLRERRILGTIGTDVKLIQRAWNTSPNPSLENRSPHYIMFGKEDDYLQNKYNIPAEHKNRNQEIADLKLFREKIPEILKKNFEKYSKYHNKTKKEITIKIGDEVLIREPFPKKMDDKYLGPCTVTKILGPTTFIVKNNENDEESRVHVSKIKKFYRRENNLAAQRS